MQRHLALVIAGWAIWATTPLGLAAEINSLPAPLGREAVWPTPTNVSQPWTRWWWLGSAVDDDDLTRLLETYHAVGLGGVEITSIYGVEGAEDRELPFLSKSWVAALRHTVREAKRLGMGVDLPTGSGWRTGGPSVTDEDENLEVVIDKTTIDGGDVYKHEFKTAPQALVAYSAEGQLVDLTDDAAGDLKFEWHAPMGLWTVYTVNQRWSKDNVKRPAPGGEGKNINPLSKHSIEHFLAYFGAALDGVPAEGIRAQFHDSYEYEGNWCDDFFAQFEQRRGYRLQDHLPALDGDGDSDEVARVKHDYRETVSDLIRDNMIQPWTDWSHEHGMLSRNQSHGSPANWLDLYAVCDIPEIESFGRLKGGDTNPLVFKFASSAAAVTGKPLVSSETATWLNEHFNATLGEVKDVGDRLMLSGVNHIVYQGTAYSPADAAWPGWLFYASVQLNPQNSIWRDFPALNEYFTRVQSVLQASQPDNDILLYWPIHDYWQDPRGLRKDLRVHNSRDWLNRTEFGQTGMALLNEGYAFDYVSDRQLSECQVVDGQIETPGKARYRVVLVPGAKYLPLSTVKALAKLADGGAVVGFVGDLPVGPPGIVSDAERSEWDETIERLEKSALPLIEGHDWKPLDSAGVRREDLGTPEQPLTFLRRAWDGGHVYFVKNATDTPFDGLVAPADEFASAVLMDPQDGRIGRAKEQASKAGKPSFRLQLEPGETMLVKTYDQAIDAPPWMYRELAGEPTPLDGMWGVEFIEGGPVLPPRFNTQRLASWNEIAGPDGERFGGTARYTIRFKPDVTAKRYLLDLGNVAESARVVLNGIPVATLVGPPYRVEVGPLLAENNELAVEVTSTAANRIRDLDRRGVKWRIFKDINFVNIDYRPFDASKWPVRPAGLLGPVTLTPLVE